MGYGQGSLIPYSIRIGLAIVRTLVISALRKPRGLRADLNFRVHSQVRTTCASSADRSILFQRSLKRVEYVGTRGESAV